MKKLLLLLPLLGACSTIGLTTAATPLQVKTAFLKDCSDFDAALTAAIAAYPKGALTPAGAQAVDSAIHSIAPICYGPVPADPTAVITQITAATTALTINTLANGVAK